MGSVCPLKTTTPASRGSGAIVFQLKTKGIMGDVVLLEGARENLKS
jgi:hypothetical protein